MNKLLIYVRQALRMMKEEKLFSGIYIAGTALAIAFTMVIAVVYFAKLADIEPEVNRSRTVYVTMKAYMREGVEHTVEWRTWVLGSYICGWRTARRFCLWR